MNTDVRPPGRMPEVGQGRGANAECAVPSHVQAAGRLPAIGATGVTRAAGAARLAGALLLLVSLGACTSFNPPQPWEKGTLARKDMTFEADPLDQRYVQHIYFSKEAASGGYGVGGGGCGCN